MKTARFSIESNERFMLTIFAVLICTVLYHVHCALIIRCTVLRLNGNRVRLFTISLFKYNRAKVNGTDCGCKNRRKRQTTIWSGGDWKRARRWCWFTFDKPNIQLRCYQMANVRPLVGDLLKLIVFRIIITDVQWSGWKRLAWTLHKLWTRAWM